MSMNRENPLEKDEINKSVTDKKGDENLPDIKHLDEKIASLPKEMTIGYKDPQA